MIELKKEHPEVHIPSLDDAPVLDETLLWIWTAFQDLSATREPGRAITWQEIFYYGEIQEFSRETLEDLIPYIEFLDGEYRKLLKKMKPTEQQGAPPIPQAAPPKKPLVVKFPRRK